jgi:hypothetical protein
VIDPRRLRPGELCRLLNSTPLGEVISERQLYRHRTRAGLRLGDTKRVDLVRYVAWLLQIRHTPKPEPAKASPQGPELAEAAEGAAAAANTWQQLKGHGQKLTRSQEALIAALLTEPSHAAAAAKAGVGTTTLYRWLQLPAFQAAYRQARLKLVDAALGRIQTGTGLATDTMLTVARHGQRDSDRLRAADLLFRHATHGLAHADSFFGPRDAASAGRLDIGDVVELLAARLRQVDAADLSTAEKSRLTAALADAWLRATGVDVLDKRLAAVQAVLGARKDQGHERKRRR